MTSPRRANALIAAVAAAWIIAAGDAAHALPARTLFAETADDATWLVRPTPPATGKGGFQALRHRPASDGASGTTARDATRDAAWVLVAPLAERPVDVATFGERLVVLYADGTWSLVGPANVAPGPALPDGWKAVAVAAAGDGLAFLARPASPDDAARATVARFTFDGAAFARAGTRTLDLRGASGVDLSGETIAVERDRAVTLLPPADAAPVTLDDLDDFAFVAGVDRVAYRRANTVTVAPLDAPAAEPTFKLPSADGRFALVAADGRRAGTRPATRSTAGSGTTRAFWIIGDTVSEQSFAADGAALGEPTPIALRPPPSPPVFERVLYGVGALTMLAVLLAGGRRTIAAARSVQRAPPPPPAPLARRLAGGVVDVLPLVACAVYLTTAGRLRVMSGMLQFDSLRSEAILGAGVALYVVLHVACELRWQRSVGKWAFALRVVAIDGTRPRRRAVLIRNVLRLVDLNLITLLLVPVSPLRQRLGDFLAGTMVVDDALPDRHPEIDGPASQDRRDPADP